MKKVILALAIVSVSFAACNNGGETETPAADTPVVETPAPAAVDTTAAPAVDTTAAPAAATEAPAAH